MEQNIALLIVAALIILVMTPLVPHMIKVRIIVLRFLRLSTFANFHETYFDRLVVIVRVMLVILALALLITVAGGFN